MYAITVVAMLWVISIYIAWMLREQTGQEGEAK